MKAEERIRRNAEVSEKSLEGYLGKLVREAGGLCLKYSNAQASGYPDRIILMKGGVTVWVELKSQGQHPTALQSHRIWQLKEVLGFAVFVCDSREKVEGAVEMAKMLSERAGLL